MVDYLDIRFVRVVCKYQKFMRTKRDKYILSIGKRKNQDSAKNIYTGRSIDIQL